VLVQCNGNATEAKDQIIGLLAEQFPITAQKLYNLMKKRYLTGLTYHAVYKHLNELAAKDVVIKSGTEYRLNGEWIKNLGAFASNLEINYAQKSATQLLADTSGMENVRLLSFNSIRSLDGFLRRLKESFVNDSNGNDKKVICWQVDHSWWNILYMQEQSEIAQKLKEKNIQSFFLIEGNTKLDNWVAEFYNKNGINAKIGIKNHTKAVLGVYGDTLIYLIYPPEMLAEIDDIFRNCKGFTDRAAGRLTDIMNKNMKLHALMIKNPYMVENYKENILSHFKAS
jgi:hypothetical protein